MGHITNPASNPVYVALVPVPGVSIIEKGRVYNTVYAGGGADVFAADLAVTNTPTNFRVIVAIDTATTCVVVRDDGVAEVDTLLNAGADLEATAEYAFDAYMTEDEDFNMEFGAACQILYLLVLEIPAVS